MNRRSLTLRCQLAALLLVASSVPAEDPKPVDEKLPPHLEGRSLIRPAEREAAGLDPYPAANTTTDDVVVTTTVVAPDEAASADEATTSSTSTATPTQTPAPRRGVPAPDSVTAPTASQAEIEARLKRNEALALQAARDPEVRRKAAEIVDRRYPGPWSHAEHRKLVNREIARLIQLGTDMKDIEEIKRTGEILGQYVTLDATDMTAARIVGKMRESGLKIDVAPELAETPVTLKLDGVRGDLAVKRLAIELNSVLFQLADGSWLIGADAAIRAAHPGARRVAPNPDPMPTATPAPTPAEATPTRNR